MVVATASAEGSGFGLFENTARGRFELTRDGELVSFAEFHADGDNVVVPHVETVHAHRGNGYAARLLDGMLDMFREQGRTITPLCSFAAGHVMANPRHRELLAK